MSFPTAKSSQYIVISQKKFGVGGNIENQVIAALRTTEISTYFLAWLGQIST
jgi:hypothetical protein